MAAASGWRPVTTVPRAAGLGLRGLAGPPQSSGRGGLGSHTGVGGVQTGHIPAPLVLGARGTERGGEEGRDLGARGGARGVLSGWVAGEIPEVVGVTRHTERGGGEGKGGDGTKRVRLMEGVKGSGG